MRGGTTLFGLTKVATALLNEVLMPRAGVNMRPTDPLIYRFYELALVKAQPGKH
jgi:cyanate lyase